MEDYRIHVANDPDGVQSVKDAKANAERRVA